MKSVPITEAARQLDAEARVRLLIQVCEAVADARARLVVHRNLKPSNVLVTDDRTVKLLDFGIAKLLDPTLDDDLTAEHARRPMTRSYAAPEQVRGHPPTTVADVYGLGLLLYKVLAGRKPFPSVGSSREQERAILEDDPPLARSPRASRRGTCAVTWT